MPLFDGSGHAFDSADEAEWNAHAPSRPSRDAVVREVGEGDGVGPVQLDFPASLLFDGRDFTANDYEMLCRLDCAVDSRKAATLEEISKIGSVHLFEDVSSAHPSSLSRCVICLERFAADDLVRKLPCQHVYHQSCIDQWLGTKASCPICQHLCKP